MKNGAVLYSYQVIGAPDYSKRLLGLTSAGGDTISSIENVIGTDFAAYFTATALTTVSPAVRGRMNMNGRAQHRA